MLLQFDHFRELDRMADQAFARTAVPAVPMDAVRKGDTVTVYLDLPGVGADSIDLEVERNVLTLRAERRFESQEGDEVLASERRQGQFTRQVFLGDTLDTANIAADFHDGVLEVVIPMAEHHKARKVTIGASDSGDRAIEVGGESAN